MEKVLKLFIYSLMLVISLSSATVSFAENEPESKGKIRGTVFDANTKEALEYATIAVYNLSENKLITGAVTDKLGHFKIDGLEPGNYYLVVSFLGMKDQKIDQITINDNLENLSLGKIILEPLSSELKEVEIVSKQATIDYKIDKKVVNVGRQITAAGESAVEVLENVPSIKVDVEGNVTLRGSGSFTVLVDGKPTILEPSDALRQIPASTIENIEIITNPSVKYHPDGTSGIINIVTKKNHLDGLSGLVNLNAGTYNTYGGDFLMSYRVNQFNFIVGANYNRRSRPGSSWSERRTYSNDTTFFVSSSGERNRRGNPTGLKAGIEFDASKNDFISIGGNLGKWHMEGSSALLYNEWTDPASNLYQYNSNETTVRGGNYYELSSSYQHKFAKKGHQLSADIIYQYHNGEEYSESKLFELDSILPNDGKKNVETGPSKEWQLNLDYTLPIKEKDKFEAGAEARIENSTDNTELYFLNPTNAEFVLQPEFSHKTNYLRNIYAVYALYGGYLNNFGYQLGLRGEYTDQIIASSGQSDYLLNRWDYFPTIHLSYQLPKENQLMASYSRRIQRPDGWELEPFITWQDEYNVRQGNPNLLPEFTDSFDASFLLKIEKGFFSIDGYYKITNNKTERVQSVFNDNVMMTTVENVGKDYSLGTELMLNYELFKWWEIDWSGNYYFYKIEGVLYDASFSRTSNNWNSRLNNTLNVHKNIQLQLISSYNSASVTAQGTSSGFFTFDTAMKFSFLKRSLAATIQARDIFRTSLRESVSEGEDFYSYNKFQPKAPVVNITLSYRFNNFKQSKKMPGEGNIGEEGY